MPFRMCLTAILILCSGCGGGSESPPVEINSKKIVNGFYLEKNNSNNTSIVSDSIAMAYSRLEAIHGLSKVISIYSHSKTDAVHKDSAPDAGSTCINALKNLTSNLIKAEQPKDLQIQN